MGSLIPASQTDNHHYYHYRALLNEVLSSRSTNYPITHCQLLASSRESTVNDNIRKNCTDTYSNNVYTYGKHYSNS